MDTDLATITPNTSLSLDPNIRQHLVSVEDFVNYYVQLEEASNSVSWIKADLLSYFVEKYGWDSINAFAGQLNIKGGTIRDYVRVSKGFPVESRLPDASFTLHFQASFADSYDGEGNFDGDKRHEWIEKAAAEGFSTRRLKEEIDHEKEKERTGAEIIPCYKCGTTEGEILRCVFYVFGNKNKADRFELCERCYAEVVAFASTSHS